MPHPHGSVVIVGAGDGLSASLARRFARDGHDIVLAARGTDKLASLAEETGARSIACDASDPAAVDALFDAVPERLAIVVHNPSARTRGPVAELDPEAVRHALEVTAFGAFLVGRRAAARMLDQDEADGARGTILFTGASAGVKGFPRSAPFAMGKFAQRGLAQSMSRELHPRGVHVAWINIDGQIGNPGVERDANRPDSMLDPGAIADTYAALARQHRSAWSEEVAVRPWTETF